MNIREKLSTIQAEFKAKKSRKNSFGNYMFRSAEDILEGLKPFNKQHGVYFTIKERRSALEPKSLPNQRKILESSN